MIMHPQSCTPRRSSTFDSYISVRIGIHLAVRKAKEERVRASDSRKFPIWQYSNPRTIHLNIILTLVNRLALAIVTMHGALDMQHADACSLQARLSMRSRLYDAIRSLPVHCWVC